jgi:pyrimidine-specific ribonucleoside hydrolase
MSVKPEIAQKMQDEIKYGVQTYGLLSDRYWLYIEDLAMDYWADFDRNEIFVIAPQPVPGNL